MENVAWGLVGFFVAMTLVLVVQIFAKVNRLDRNVGLLLKQAGIEPDRIEPSALVRELARDPARRIEAIKALREETGAGLAEAKKVVEDLYRQSGA